LPHPAANIRKEKISAQGSQKPELLTRGTTEIENRLDTATGNHLEDSIERLPAHVVEIGWKYEKVT
jgi:hypothetical protein